MNLDESVDSFGLPLAEARHRANYAEEARDRLEKAKDNVRDALDELRNLQLEYNASERVSAEIKSSIVACIDVEKSLITAIHRAENLIHRVRKLSMTGEDTKKKIDESFVVDVPFESKNKKLLAQFKVSGKVELDNKGEPQWVGDYDIKSVGVKDSKGEEVDIEIQPVELKRLEDKALAQYADQYLGDEDV